MTQMGFFDPSDRYASLDAKKHSLVEINEVVTWDEFSSPLERVWRKLAAERKSRARRKTVTAPLIPQFTRLDGQLQWPAAPSSTAAIHPAC